MDLTICQNTKIYVNIPVSIEEDKIYKYNPNSEYYNNSCYPDNIECDNENILDERKNEFNNSLSLCEINCIYKDYDISTKNVICECNIKTEFSSLSEIINKKDNNRLLYYIKNLESSDSMEKNTDNPENSDSVEENTDNPENSDSMETNTDNPENSNSMETSIETNSDTSEELASSGDSSDYIFILNKEKTIDEIFDHYHQELVNKNINMEQDTIIQGEDLLFQATTSERQLNYINDDSYDNSISCIDLFECEEALKEKYGIEEPLIILKLDIKRDDTNSTQVEYQVFNPNTLAKLDLSVCYQKQVNIYVPINLDQNLLDLANQLNNQEYDLFDSSDSFYNEICTPYTSINDTDVILNDRKNDFYMENITFCEEGCEYENFDFETNRAKCQCVTKLEVKSEEEVEFSPNKILQNFYNVEKYTNIKIFICYKLVFNLNNLKLNLGSYILLSISLLYIIIMGINFMTFKNKIGKFVDKVIGEYQNLMRNLKKYKEKNSDKKQHNTNNDSSNIKVYKKEKKSKIC